MNETRTLVVAFAAVLCLSLFLAWLAMLTAGNFGFPQYGYVEFLPVGYILFWLGKSTYR